MSRIRLEVYDVTDTTVLAVSERIISLSWDDVVDEIGKVTFQLSLSDPVEGFLSTGRYLHFYVDNVFVVRSRMYELARREIIGAHTVQVQTWNTFADLQDETGEDSRFKDVAMSTVLGTGAAVPPIPPGLLWGTGWTLNIEAGCAAVLVTQEAQDETLAALIGKIVKDHLDAAGAAIHWRVDSVTKTLYVGLLGASSGIRLANPQSPPPDGSLPTVVLESLQERGTGEVINSIDAYGGNNGSDRLQLPFPEAGGAYAVQQRTSRMGVDINYIEDAASVAAYGRKRKPWSDNTQNPQNLSESEAKQALYRAACSFLARAKDEHKAWGATGRGTGIAALAAGQSAQLWHHDAFKSTTVTGAEISETVTLDETVYLTKIEKSVGKNGIQYQLELATSLDFKIGCSDEDMIGRAIVQAMAATGRRDVNRLVTSGIVGTGSYAPIDAQYIIRTASAALINARVLTAGVGITLTDGGAGGPLTVDCTVSSGWSLTGNAGTNPAVNFLGTTDNQDVVFGTNNVERVRIKSDAACIGIGMAPTGGGSIDALAGIRCYSGDIRAAGSIQSDAGNIIASAGSITADVGNITAFADLTSSNGNIYALLGFIQAQTSLKGNESGADNDSYIKGLTDDNLFYVDAGTDRVGIGVNAPTSKLDIAGDVEITSSLYYYIGDPSTNGSWRIGQGAGVDLLFQRRDAGVWTTHDVGGGHDEVTLSVAADTLLSLTGQEIGLDVKAKNLVFAGPALGADAAPTFRSLVSDDIPDLSGTYMTPAAHTAIGDGAPHHAAVTLGADADVLLGLSGQQIVFDTQAANRVLAGPTTGAAADPTFRAMVSADIPNPLFLGDTSNANMTLGLTVNQGANTDEILALKASSVDHGITDIAETDTYGTCKLVSATAGGLVIDGLSEATLGLLLRGLGVTDNTTKSTAGTGYLELRAGKKSGTGLAVAGADANLVVIRNLTTTRFIFDAEGSAHADVEWIAFDEHDDLALLDQVEETMLAQRDPVKREFGAWLDENKAQLEQLGLVHFDRKNPGHAMINTTRMMMLLTGALRQVGQRVKQIQLQGGFNG